MHCGHGIPKLRVRDAAVRAIGNTRRILEEAIGTEGWDEKKDKLGRRNGGQISTYKIVLARSRLD